MAYRHYQTEGLILGSKNFGEANRLFQIFTNDFGLIQTIAQGVRLNKSKLRYHLSNYSLIDLDLVRGREYWRLTGVSQISGSQKKFGRQELTFWRKISLILSRLIHGEATSQKIFTDLKNIWNLTMRETGDWEKLEIFTMIRLLADLGYLADDLVTAPILSPADFSWVEIDGLINDHLTLIKLINLALQSSGL